MIAAAGGADKTPTRPKLRTRLPITQAAGKVPFINDALLAVDHQRPATLGSSPLTSSLRPSSRYGSWLGITDADGRPLIPVGFSTGL